MKYCNKCKRELSEDKFGRNCKKIRSICKECQNRISREGQHRTREYIQSLKTKCSKCGYDKCKSALEWHHIDPSEKDSTLSYFCRRMFSDNTKKIVDNEISKCILLCANCHREEHSS